MTKTLLSLSIVILAVGLTACQSDTFKEAAVESPAPSPAPAADPATTDEPEIEYEPAYPSDVSSEELTDDDVSQQETHSHEGGEEHSHGDGSPTHGEDGEDDDNER